MFQEYIIEYTEDMVYVNGVTEDNDWIELWNEEIDDPYDFALGIGNALNKTFNIPVDVIKISEDEEVETD